MIPFQFFVLGLGALVAGAELLVRDASRLALSFGISPLPLHAQPIRREVPTMDGASRLLLALAIGLRDRR